jgi:hypothetical protein
MLESATKTYPKSLHMYKIQYSDNECRVLCACGMTHAYTMSKEYWPDKDISVIDQLDDSWKN